MTKFPQHVNGYGAPQTPYADQLLREALEMLNDAPRFALRADKLSHPSEVRDSYKLAAKIGAYLRLNEASDAS